MLICETEAFFRAFWKTMGAFTLVIVVLAVMTKLSDPGMRAGIDTATTAAVGDITTMFHGFLEMNFPTVSIGGGGTNDGEATK